jgi:hypothetical protein
MFTEPEAVLVVTPVLTVRNGPQDLQATMKGAFVSTPHTLWRNENDKHSPGAKFLKCAGHLKKWAEIGLTKFLRTSPNSLQGAQ